MLKHFRYGLPFQSSEDLYDTTGTMPHWHIRCDPDPCSDGSQERRCMTSDVYYQLKHAGVQDFRLCANTANQTWVEGGPLGQKLTCQ